jgi:hypothetical protein
VAFSVNGGGKTKNQRILTASMAEPTTNSSHCYHQCYDTELTVPSQCRAPVFTSPSMDERSFIVTQNIIKPGDYSCKISTVTFYSNFLGWNFIQ